MRISGFGNTATRRRDSCQGEANHCQGGKHLSLVGQLLTRVDSVQYILPGAVVVAATCKEGPTITGRGGLEEDDFGAILWRGFDSDSAVGRLDATATALGVTAGRR
jgi:hypothetical protein